LENQEIIKLLKMTASLMELHEENPFKIRSYQNTIFKLEKINVDLKDLSEGEIEVLEGIGKSMASKLYTCIKTGILAELASLAEKTPKGVIEMLNIKGLGPKKIKSLWKDSNICTKEELLAACNNNQIAGLKGFGEKTQQAIKEALVFIDLQKDKFLYAEIESLSESLEKLIKASGKVTNISSSGAIRRKLEVVEVLQFIAATNNPVALHEFLDAVSGLSKDIFISGPFVWRGKENSSGAKIEIKICSESEFGNRLYIHSASKEHLTQEFAAGQSIYAILSNKKFSSEEEVFGHLAIPPIVAEYREGYKELAEAKENRLPSLVTNEDLKGILHNHSTYSDGTNTLEEMAMACKEMGYEYLGISDHSKTAFYANGLKEDRILEQHKEIDLLNQKLAPFKIFKGIESDILNDGALDYDDAVLASFDFIVASVHSNLKMDIDKATSRLLKAIENPYTTMLGHATGRLLLKREGYPLDFKKIIDACAANEVIIEINANPRRLDMDWRWVRYALEKNIMISINPDAHSVNGYNDMKYGMYMGRKAGLTKEMTFNALSLEEMENYLAKKKKAILNV
jgi:DNA polymerase (family X)